MTKLKYPSSHPTPFATLAYAVEVSKHTTKMRYLTMIIRHHIIIVKDETQTRRSHPFAYFMRIFNNIET